MGARNMSNSEWFAKHMQELHAELERDRRIRARERKEHRLAWRREYQRKKKTETAPHATAENLAVLVKDKSEQKRAGKIQWRLKMDAGLEETKSLSKWCQYVCAQFGASITPVELEALLRDEKYFFRSVGQIVEHLKMVSGNG